jgi:hypothetical protein
MAERLKLDGWKQAEYVTLALIANAQLQRMIHDLDKDPPDDEEGWAEYYRHALRMSAVAFEEERELRQALDTIAGWGYMEATGEPVDVLRSLVCRLEEQLGRLRQRLEHLEMVEELTRPG